MVEISSLTQKLEQHLKMAPKIGYTILFQLKDDDQSIYLDGHQQPAAITILSSDEANTTEADTTLILDKANLSSILDGVLDPNMAALTGKMKVEGKMGVAMKLASLLED